MRYCKKCVQPDTRPGVVFNEDGVCAACIHQENIHKGIDWKAREKELQEIADWAKKTTRSNYDCVIGVSGGKDSTFQALYARDRLGLRVLLVNSEPEGITDIGRHNIENLKNLGFDTIAMRPNPRVMQKLVKKDFYRYLNPGKVTEYSLWASAYIIADFFDVPLIIQGENPGLTLGVTKTTGTDGNALNANKQNTISKNYLDEYAGEGITEKDLFMFNYDRERLEKKGTKGVWLNYYAKEWSQPGNARFSMEHGLKIKPKDFNFYDIGTYKRYSQLDGDLVHLNQMLKFIKFGFGQANDHACYDIREGFITRDQGIKLIYEFDGKCSEAYIKQFCNWIDISVEEFWKVANSFRGKMWEQDKNGSWKLIDPLWEQEDSWKTAEIDSVLAKERSL